VSIKYCEDCKHFKSAFWGREDGQCRSPNVNVKVSWYDGKYCITRRKAPYASIERSYGNCGIEGKNWEGKE